MVQLWLTFMKALLFPIHGFIIQYLNSMNFEPANCFQYIWYFKN